MHRKVADLIQQPFVVVDAGARNGFQLIPQLHHHIKLFAFEPDPRSYSSLLERYRNSQQFCSAQCFPLALSDENGTTTLYGTAHPSMSSLMKADKNLFAAYTQRMADAKTWLEGFDVVAQHEVQQTTLQNWCEEQQLQHIDFLKLDTQGSELKILKGAQQLLDQIKIGVVFTEFSMVSYYENQVCFSELDQWMKARGYQLIDIRAYPEITNRLHNSNSGTIKEQPRFGMVGDAVYVPNTTNDYHQPESVAALLVALGYYSRSESIFKTCGYVGQKIESLFRQLSKTSGREKLKQFLHRWTPPGIHYWYAKLRS
jgi:FkbM family methyltransferase